MISVFPTPVGMNRDPCIDINGINICELPPSDKDCYSFNGVETCIGTVDGCGSVDGVALCKDDPLNCGSVNGETVCITDQVPTVNTTCMAYPETCAKNPPPAPISMTNGDQTIYVTGSAGVKETTETSVTTNPDGTTTMQQVTSTNVAGDNVETVTTETAADGSTTQTTENSNDGTGSVNAPSSDFGEGLGGADTAMNEFLDSVVGEDGQRFNDSSFLDWVFPSLTGSCQGIPLVMNTTWVTINQTFDPCDKLQPMREIIGWALYLYTVFTLFRIVTKPKSI